MVHIFPGWNGRNAFKGKVHCCYLFEHLCLRTALSVIRSVQALPLLSDIPTETCIDNEHTVFSSVSTEAAVVSSLLLLPAGSQRCCHSPRLLCLKKCLRHLQRTVPRQPHRCSLFVAPCCLAYSTSACAFALSLLLSLLKVRRYTLCVSRKRQISHDEEVREFAFCWYRSAHGRSHFVLDLSATSVPSVFQWLISRFSSEVETEACGDHWSELREQNPCCTRRCRLAYAEPNSCLCAAAPAVSNESYVKHKHLGHASPVSKV